MEHWGPLLQTVLWVGLIGAVIWWARAPLHGILNAVQKRIEGGSEIKAGPFSIVDPLRPQQPGEQLQKIEEEAQALDLDQSSAEGGLAPEPVAPARDEVSSMAKPLDPSQANGYERISASRAVRTQMALQSEDLVIRLLQSEYGVAIQRQMTGGKDPGYDGVFSTPMGRVSIIEVKFVSAGTAIKVWPRLRDSIAQVANSVHNYGWDSPQLIVAIVFEDVEDIARALPRFKLDISRASGDIVIRAFAYDELVRRFRPTPIASKDSRAGE